MSWWTDTTKALTEAMRAEERVKRAWWSGMVLRTCPDLRFVDWPLCLAVFREEFSEWGIV